MYGKIYNNLKEIRLWDYYRQLEEIPCASNI